MRSNNNKIVRSKIFNYRIGKFMTILSLVVFVVALYGIFNKEVTIILLCATLSLALGGSYLLFNSNKVESELHDRWDRFNTLNN